MNVLVTSARFPVALDEIRKFGRRGHRVVAADSFRAAPGAFSRWVSARAHVAAPERDADRFLADVKQLVFTRRIDLLVPCFEEVFYLARELESLSEVVQVFAPPLDVLQRLHDKASFNVLARALGLAAPDTIQARDSDELDAALDEFPRYFARPVFSRGGIDVLTNVGPLAGAIPRERVHPTARQPWIVQEYVDGIDLCTFSVARRGRVVAHCAYVHPREIEHAGGIVFESIDAPESLRAVETIVEATGYNGQLGCDFRRSPRGLFAIECNVRPTAGVHLMSDEQLVSAILDEPPERPFVVPPGRRRLYASALVRDLVLHPRQAGVDLAYLLSSAHDVYAEAGDWLPAVMQLLSFVQVASYRSRHAKPLRDRTTLMAAYFDGLVWDGG